MSAEEFWEGESWLAKSYREAHRIRMETEMRTRDRDAWNLGQYIRYALVSVGITVNGFAPKNHHLTPYPEVPFFEKYEENKREENKKKAQDNQQTLAMALFQAFTEKMNKGIQKRLDKEKNGEKHTVT